MSDNAMKPHERIVRQLQHNCEYLDESCSRCRVHIPSGFPFQGFLLSDGKPALHTIFGLFQEAQFVMDTPLSSDPDRSSCNIHTLMAEYFAFGGSAKLEIDQRIYSIQTPKYPLSIESSLRHVGRSSFSRTFIMTGPSNKYSYATLLTAEILVDRNSRKPTPFPEEWRKKYSELIPNGKPAIMKNLIRPPDARISARRICFLDIDEQKHTNWGSYFKFCFDTFQEGVIKRWFKKLNDEVISFGIKCFEILFQKESSFDDRVQVFVWEPENTALCDICFEIVTDSFVCIQAKMTFFREHAQVCEASDVDLLNSKV